MAGKKKNKKTVTPEESQEQQQQQQEESVQEEPVQAEEEPVQAEEEPKPEEQKPEETKPEEKKPEEQKPEEKKDDDEEDDDDDEEDNEPRDPKIHDYWYPDWTVNGKEVAARSRIYLWLILLLLSVLVAGGAVVAYLYAPPVQDQLQMVQELADTVKEIPATTLSYAVGAAMLCFIVVSHIIYYINRHSRKPVYLLDFSILHPSEDMVMTSKRFMLQSKRSKFFGKDALQFQKRLLRRTGLGEHTYLPRPFFDEKPGPFTIDQAREEAMETITGCCDDLFAKTGISPQEIDFVVFNCSLFCPTPSLSAMIINHYKMRSDVKNYQLGGMGCSSGLIAIDLARDLLNVYPEKNALVFSTENITMNWYPGQVRGMAISNTLFRVGGAAILLTNKKNLRSRCKYELETTVRVNAAADDDSHRAIYQMQDPDGNRGVKLSRELSKCVNRALTKNFTILGPQVLPLSEIIKYAYHMVLHKINKEHKIPMPNFRKAFQHLCIHAGGRAIIDGIQETLKLTDEDCMPSRATLYRYGNTSSSSVWYELNYIECRGKVKKGDHVFQVAFGSGLKCNSVVWKARFAMPAKEGTIPEVLQWN